MIPIYDETQALSWLASRKKTIARQWQTNQNIESSVRQIISEVASDGDPALTKIASRLGDKPLRILAADSEEVAEACARVPAANKEVMKFAADRIRQFAEATMQLVAPVRHLPGSAGILPASIRVPFPGYDAGLEFRPIQRAACYVPAGRYPLPSTALMTTITAQVAGVEEIYLFTPDLRDEIIFAGVLGGVKKFYQVGGAQAIAAAAFGTESIQQADIVVGPGNAYVTEAKRQLSGVVAIDMLAGPSEVVVFADGTANPEWIAADLIAQCEHDPNAQGLLVTTDKNLATAVSRAVLSRVTTSTQLPEFIKDSVGNSGLFVLDSIQKAVDFVNAVAPEHLSLQVTDTPKLKQSLRNYGALFIGENMTVPFGDYVAGPNHTLPTNGTARFSSGLSPLTFLRTQTWAAATSTCDELIEATSKFAEIEGLHAHRDAAAIRASHATSLA